MHSAIQCFGHVFLNESAIQVGKERVKGVVPGHSIRRQSLEKDEQEEKEASTGPTAIALPQQDVLH